MKKIRKLFAAVLTLVVALAVSNVALAAGTGTITITPPASTDEDATNTYQIYKVFDADGDGTNISYKLIEGETTAPDGFKVDTAGNVTYTGEGKNGQLTDDDIEALTAYVVGMQPTATATSTGTNNATATGLPNGYYFITTSTGTVVTINSTNPNANVFDKNIVPSVDKTITSASSVDSDGKKALAQVGTDVAYKAEITVGRGAKGYVFHDTMAEGLSYKGDAAVSGVAADSSTYTVGKEGNDTFTITFSDDYIKDLKEGTMLTITYSATVNNNAITMDPLKNTCYVSYGDAGSGNKTPVSQADVYEAKFTVTKHNDEDQGLGGAGFVIKNAEGKYYKLEGATDDAGKKTATVTWVEDIKDATENTSNDQGQVTPFTGLADGTYTLVEKTVPSGYNKAADYTFTVAKGNYTAANLEQETTVINHTGAVLPGTGGIGTTIFYIVGGILLVGGAVMYITRKRVAKIEDES